MEKITIYMKNYLNLIKVIILKIKYLFFPPTIEVFVFTFNHEYYISQALKSINNQICNYKIRITIYDDCSTDNTKENILHEMQNSPHSWKLISAKENMMQNGMAFFGEMLLTSKANFLAILDGDDYWTDQYKIQKQANKLMYNLKASLCHHSFSVIKENDILYTWPPQKWRNDQPGYALASENFIGTLTVFFRRKCLPRIIDSEYNNLKMGDYPLWALITQNKNIVYIDEDMASYRIHSNNIYANLPEEVKREYIEQVKSYVLKRISKNESVYWLNQKSKYSEN